MLVIIIYNEVMCIHITILFIFSFAEQGIIRKSVSNLYTYINFNNSFLSVQVKRDFFFHYHQNYKQYFFQYKINTGKEIRNKNK